MDKLIFDLSAFAGVFAALCVWRVVSPRAFNAGDHAFRALARRKTVASATVGLLALAGAVSLTALFGIPEPNVHDEFSYLLAADTLARGRLTNPAHPLWESFETIHVNVHPTYHSMYPPAQGAALAVGQALSGYPIVGVWLSMAVGCSAVCWMMQAWMPVRWALLGALFATLRLTFAPYPAAPHLHPGYWSYSYWGGGVALMGGALLWGAVGRLVKQPSNAAAVTLGLGCAILANSRPFEGLFAALIGLAVVAGRTQWLELRRLVVPISAVLAPTAAFMLYYDTQTTKHALVRPYELNMATYQLAPPCLLQEPRTGLECPHESLCRFYRGWASGLHQHQQCLTGFLSIGKDKVVRLFDFFFGSVVMLPMILSALTLRVPVARVAILGSVAVIWPLAHMTWFEPHYLAPVAGLFYLLVTQGARWFAVLPWLRRSIGPVFPPALLVALVISAGVGLADSLVADRSQLWHLERATIIKRLSRTDQKHLILVRYHSDYSPLEQWVYNAADIDSAPVVWAHGDNEDRVQELLRYFGDRQVWRLEASIAGVELVSFFDGERESEHRP